MNKTYTWANKNCKTISLEMTTETSILRDRLDIKFKADVDGSKFFGSVFRGEDVQDEIRMRGPHNGKSTDVLVMLPVGVAETIKADLAAAESAFQHDFWHGSHLYTVNASTSYGIYNGFGPAIESMISQIIARIDPDNAAELRYSEDATRKIMGILKDRFSAKAQAIYVPYPANDSWSDEYKAAYRSRVANRTARGEAEIPAEEISAAIEQIVRELITESAPEIVKSLEAYLSSATDMSDAQARKAEYEYNEINNEGGFGYVPHYIGREEAAAIRGRLESLNSLVAKIGTAADKVPAGKHRYDLSKIMIRAWEIRKATKADKSEALKQAWSEAKANVEKQWS